MNTMNNITDTEALRAAWTLKKYCRKETIDRCEGCNFRYEDECELNIGYPCSWYLADLTKGSLTQAAKSDAGKARLSLVPTQIIYDIARIREYGTEKYKDPDNWKIVEPQRYIDAAYRHFLEFVKDKDSVDKESGMKHLWHCACNMAFLCEMQDMASKDGGKK